MKKRSNKELQEANDALHRECAVNCTALNALVNNEVKWLRGRAAYGIRVGLCRLIAPHGGVVIIEHTDNTARSISRTGKKYAYAKYLDDWAHDIIKRTPHDSETHNLYSLASAALRARQAEYDEEAA